MNSVIHVGDLVGKTIVAAEMKKLKDCDDQGFLLLTFSDQSRALVIASYGGYTGKSEDEYPTYLYLSVNPEEKLKQLTSLGNE